LPIKKCRNPRATQGCTQGCRIYIRCYGTYCEDDPVDPRIRLFYVFFFSKTEWKNPTAAQGCRTFVKWCRTFVRWNGIYCQDDPVDAEINFFVLFPPFFCPKTEWKKTTADQGYRTFVTWYRICWEDDSVDAGISFFILFPPFFSPKTEWKKTNSGPGMQDIC